MKNFSMIFLFLVIFLNHAKACQISIPESYVPTFLNPPVSGHYKKCEKEPCKCVDNVDPWISEYVTEFSQDEFGINIEKKVFKVSEVKKAAYEEAKLAKKQAEETKLSDKQAALDRIKDIKAEDILDDATRDALLIDLIKLVKDIE
jgi:hypothetical protein